MNHQKHKAEILEQIQYLRKSRIYFQNYERAPMFGTFVETEDQQEMEDKGYVRFVSDRNIDQWEETKNVHWTKVLAIYEIKYIELF